MCGCVSVDSAVGTAKGTDGHRCGRCTREPSVGAEQRVRYRRVLGLFGFRDGVQKSVSVVKAGEECATVRATSSRDGRHLDHEQDDGRERLVERRRK
jgi:hypothetical protein